MAAATDVAPAEIIAFWREAGPAQWYAKDDGFDAELRRRFLGVWEAARDGRLASWEDSDEGALALILVLDQFSRNMFRNDARAFSADEQARAVAGRAIAKGVDQRIEPALRAFMYLPFEHSEEMADQERSVALFRAMGDAESLKWADLHLDIIKRFGRFPHRNAVLGRATTPEEEAFLTEGGFKG
ncbi:MAG: DUF924 domain-containing protein [Proteobacteria bacterium]|nr:MAG: DUF924 domain-containing protein [Pseudomonadota bacterium]